MGLIGGVDWRFGQGNTSGGLCGRCDAAAEGGVEASGLGPAWVVGRGLLGGRGEEGDEMWVDMLCVSIGSGKLQGAAREVT